MVYIFFPYPIVSNLKRAFWEKKREPLSVADLDPPQTLLTAFPSSLQFSV